MNGTIGISYVAPQSRRRPGRFTCTTVYYTKGVLYTRLRYSDILQLGTSSKTWPTQQQRPDVFLYRRCIFVKPPK